MAQNNLFECGVLVPQTNEWLSAPSLLPKRFVTTSEPQAESIVSEDLCSTSAPVSGNDRAPELVREIDAD
jgi:hypothetical protein